MPEYDTRTGVKHLRVRGLKNVQYCARLKATCVNIFRATNVRNARKRGKSPSAGPLFLFYMVFLTVKERIQTGCDILISLSHNHADDYRYDYNKVV